MHNVYGVQLVALSVAALNVPAAQLLQTWFTLDVPAVEMYCPAVQPVYGVQAATILVVASVGVGVPVPTVATLNVPAAHGKQVGATDRLATGLEYWPATQLVGYGTHAALVGALMVLGL